MITAAVARASQACWTKWENSLCSRRTYYVDGAGGCGDAHQAELDIELDGQREEDCLAGPAVVANLL